MHILDKLWLYRMSLDLAGATEDLAEYHALIASIKSLDKIRRLACHPKTHLLILIIRI